jgi:hypothetical protein
MLQMILEGAGVDYYVINVYECEYPKITGIVSLAWPVGILVGRFATRMAFV